MALGVFSQMLARITGVNIPDQYMDGEQKVDDTVGVVSEVSAIVLMLSY